MKKLVRMALASSLLWISLSGCAAVERKSEKAEVYRDIRTAEILFGEYKPVHEMYDLAEHERIR